jgi:hypothetical protein
LKRHISNLKLFDPRSIAASRVPFFIVQGDQGKLSAKGIEHSKTIHLMYLFWVYSAILPLKPQFNLWRKTRNCHIRELHCLIIDMDLNDFPNAKKVTTDTFFLGTSPVITEEQISYIGEVVDSFFEDFVK